MAELEPQLVSHLQNDSQLSVLIDGRVYPGHLPDPYLVPAVVYQRISTVREVDYSGAIIAPSEARFQFDVWSKSQGQTRTVAGALRASLLGFAGGMGPFYVGIPRQTNDLDMFEDDTNLYRVMTEFIIWHDEGDA